MILRLLVAAGRYNQQLLVGGLLLVVAVLLAGALGLDRSVLVLVPATLAGGLVLLILSLFFSPSGRHPPAVLLVDEDGRSFRTRRTAVHTLAGIAHFAVLGIVILFADETSPVGLKDLLLFGAFVVLFPCYLPAMWRGLGVTITASGIRAEKFAGVVTVPWEAIEAAEVESGNVTLIYERPDLVRVSGGWALNRREMLAEGTDVAFLAQVVEHYRAHPEERAWIGTPAGLDRLRAAVDQAGKTVEETEPLGRAGAVALGIVCLLIAAGAVAADIWVGDRLGDESTLAWLVHVGAGTFGVAAGGGMVTAIREFRRAR